MLEILYRDDWLVAIQKPSGLLVHRSPIAAQEERFAVQLLRDQIGRRVYPAHRLDRGTSGVLLFALDREVARTLAQRFESQAVDKRYLAIVRGHPPEHGLIDHALVRRLDPVEVRRGKGTGARDTLPEDLDEAQRRLATELMEAVGLVEWVEEEALLDAVTAVSGSAPAYFFLMFEAMEEAGVKLGLPADTARRLAMQTALGAAKMALASDKPPAELKRNVMSPGGTTERAISHLEDAGLRRIMEEAMTACADRAGEMAEELGKR